MTTLYPDMRFSWEIKSVDALFANGLSRAGDLSREAILQSIREQDLSILKEDTTIPLFKDKKFCKECIATCVHETRKIELLDELIDFLIGSSEETRRHVDACIREAISCAVKSENDQMVINLLVNCQNNKKIKTLTDPSELFEHSVYSAAVEQNSTIMQTILKWNQNGKGKKLTQNKSRGLVTSAPSQSPKVNSTSLLYAAKKNDYDRVKILFRYGYRLERMEKITDPLKRIELFKAISSPAYIMATLDHCNDAATDFFCPVKKCFEFACEASAKAKAAPEYKKEYQEIEHRCENFAISLLEQCENLEEVETFLQTQSHDGVTHKDANYIMAILDQRKKFVAHERFQYVLLKRFGESDIGDRSARQQLLWIDMPWYHRCLHVTKQIPCYFLLFLFPLFSHCCPWTNSDLGSTVRVPWFVKQWQAPLNRCIYTAFSYTVFLVYISLYVAEMQPPGEHWLDALTAIWIISYTCRDMGTAYFLWKLENPKPMSERRFFKRYLTFWHLYNLFADFFFLIGLVMKLIEYLMEEADVADHPMVNLNNMGAAGRILWGAAFCLAILKTIKVGIASKYMGPIILSLNYMMKDVLLFLITFTVIMLAFASGVAYIFNMASDQQGSGEATSGVFTYFFWVLLQPFRGNPEYKDVADLPYNSSCLNRINSEHTDIKSLGKCIVEALYNTSCIMETLSESKFGRITKKDIAGCLLDKDAGFGMTMFRVNYLKSAAVPMWAVYQFLISVVLLRILIVMMTITYRKIYDDLENQWKYARAYTGIQFFDSDSLLPPPFTFLSILVFCAHFVKENRNRAKQNQDSNALRTEAIDQAYPSLIFALIDSVRPKTKDRKKVGGPDGSGGGGGGS